jgi:hypothetical protein
MISSEVVLTINAALVVIIPAAAYFVVSWLRAKADDLKRRQDETYEIAAKSLNQSRQNSEVLSRNTTLTEKIAVATNGNQDAARASGYIAGQIAERLSRNAIECDEGELDELEKAFKINPRKDEEK